MPRRSKKRKAKQILVTKEKLQQLEQAKQEEVKQAKVVKQEIKQEVKQEVKTIDFCDMLGKPLFVGDNVVYVYSNKQGKTSTKAGIIDNFTNKSIVVKTLDDELIKVRNVIKLEVTKKIVRKVVKQEIKKLSILEYIKGMFIKK